MNKKVNEGIQKLLLFRILGWEGVGVYYGLLERFKGQEWLPYDLELISYDMRTRRGLLKKVVGDYNLFILSKSKRRFKLRYPPDEGINKKEGLRVEKKHKMKYIKKRTKFIPPSVLEVDNYIKEKGFKVDAEKFCAYYGSRNWKIGGNKVDSWQLLVSLWHRNIETNFKRKTDNRIHKQDENGAGYYSNSKWRKR